ncbi:hypothetical protein Vretimale_9653 [Volvox reticuliferus]|uniref:Uncharacterized protein n=1 Tax=Volvox reticuliferus TaxID=1737510 RepID=A0A8J4D115_9CHLO|nr:hypothetical protein Vretifemale_19181 [Volvox reticuliferus]GIM05208.1 hypothetical protein Vretimale_9653 [Volvox reticuliferus]
MILWQYWGHLSVRGLGAPLFVRSNIGILRQALPWQAGDFTSKITARLWDLLQSVPELVADLHVITAHSLPKGVTAAANAGVSVLGPVAAAHTGELCPAGLADDVYGFYRFEPYT